MKLSKNQQEVIDYMKQGWELAVSRGWFSRAWIQKEGIGRGGKTKTVNRATVWALKNKGVIEAIPQTKSDGLDTTRYKLIGEEKVKQKP